MKKIIIFMLASFSVILCNLSGDSNSKPDTSHLSQDSDISGLWLECWYHYDMYSPGSYGAYENPNFETFYLFNSDGTGFYFERNMNIFGLDEKNSMYGDIIDQINRDDSLSYTVVVRDENDNWMESDVLSRKRVLFWGLNSEKKVELYIEDYSGEFEHTIHDFEYNPGQPRSEGFLRSIDRYILGKELQILQKGSLKKVSETGKDALLARYF